MLLFHNDYNESCHPKILEKMNCRSREQSEGYGEDAHCARAGQIIRDLCGRQDADVHFLVGGTQTNMTVIDAALRPHQAALSAVTGHINVHETGAVESTGHKVIGLPSSDGKITAQQIRNTMQAHLHDGSREHTVQPKLVYISNPTELGTIYTLAQLEELSNVCREYGLYLFLDGARLGYGLAARGNDVSLADIARLTDVFYIGGTKCGALFGEAVVITNSALKEDFRYLIKQHGAMLAKGWLLGIQFETLLEDDLYFEIAAHADQMADRIRTVLAQCGYRLFVDGVTNQVFVVLPDAILEALSKDFTFNEQERVDNGHRAVRFCTSWATQESDVDALCRTLRKLSE